LEGTCKYAKTIRATKSDGIDKIQKMTLIVVILPIDLQGLAHRDKVKKNWEKEEIKPYQYWDGKS
jgi:hypothetical protein